MRRYTKQERDHAAIIASALAFEHAQVEAGKGAYFNIDTIAAAIGASPAAIALYRSARGEVGVPSFDGCDIDTHSEWGAATDQLLRSGWTPP